MPRGRKPKFPRAEGVKAVRLDLPDAEHAALRVLAAESGLPMSDYVARVVLEAIKQRRTLPQENGEARQ